LAQAANRTSFRSPGSREQPGKIPVQSLTVDAADAHSAFGRNVPVSLVEGLRRTGRWYAQS
jgi:nucleoside-diphosphate-sugar epimerase